MYLELERIAKSFGHTRALDDVSLGVARGELVCLLGPSGCGKSTLLRVVAGLETPDGGRVLLEGQDLAGVPAHARGVGLMFQDYALFPHLNVWQNVAFGLRMRGESRTRQRARAAELLELIGLAGMAERDVAQLSGGERQRVALARSLAPGPRLLMLDEPLGALDRTLRERLMDELRAILAQLGMTVLYVTHDQAEAFALADRVALLERGRIVQAGPPHELYRRPQGEFAARFLGMHNILPARALAPDRAETALGALAVSGAYPAGAQAVLVRPEAARLVPGAEDAVDGAGPNAIRARVLDSSFRGRLVHVVVQPAQGPVLAFELDGATVATLPAAGADVRLALDPEGIVWLNPSSSTS
jgi:thiamine transport system ATP-binding protein